MAKNSCCGIGPIEGGKRELRGVSAIKTDNISLDPSGLGVKSDPAAVAEMAAEGHSQAGGRLVLGAYIC